jgi:type IV pilus assembly protein PilA
VRKYSGFSLIELLIVVAIILIVAAIAIPNLLRARTSAQEAAAVNHMKTVVTAETTYSTTYPACGFVPMTALGGNGSGPSASGILDNVFPDREGYHFDINLSGPSGNCGVTSGATYNIQASPISPLPSQRYFYTDGSGVIRFSFGAAAQVTDPVIQ